MENIFDYYLIVNLESLLYLGYDGELTGAMNNAKKFRNIKDVAEEFNTLDDPKDFAIYQVDVVEEYSFKLVKEIIDK